MAWTVSDKTADESVGDIAGDVLLAVRGRQNQHHAR